MAIDPTTGQELEAPQQAAPEAPLFTSENIESGQYRQYIPQAIEKLKQAGITNPTEQQISQQFNLGGYFQVARDIERAIKYPGQILNDAGTPGKLETESFAERSALGATGTVVGTGDAYWDEGRGVTVHAPIGSHFEFYAGGGVKRVDSPLPQGSTGAPASSLFNQPTAGGKPVEGFKQEQLAIKPIEGKTIERTGQTVKNPQTGVDEYAGEGEILIQYTDGTVERRKVSDINAPGTATPIGEFGRTAEELGITRSTEIKGGAGDEITRAPQSAAQVLQDLISKGASAEEIDEFLQSEGQTSTRDFELIGKSYKGRTAGEGMMFYQDPTNRKIVERPEQLKELAQPSTSPSITGAGQRDSVNSMFRSVFGREPTADEFKYWMGRTDKTGAALFGAMQFAKEQGKAIGGTPKGAATADPVESLKSAANIAQGKLAAAYADAGITTGSSEKRALRAEIEALKAPEAESLEEFTKDQLASSQFQEAQNDLNKAKDALRKLDSGHIINLQEAEHGARARGLTTAQVRRNQTEADVAYQRARAELVNEVQMYNDIVQSQMTITGLMIDAFKYDQNAAQVDYQNRFNRATALYEMVATEERDAFNMSQKLQDNQRANLSVITGLIAEGRINYDNMSPDAKAQITAMERATGLTGLSQAIAKTPMAPVVSIGSKVTAADGTVYTPIFSQDPVTGEVTVNNYKHPIKEKVTSASGGGSDILSGLGSLLSGVLGAESDWEIDSSDSDNNLEPPPMMGIPGTKLEYPNGSGIYWTANNKGVWE